MAIPLLEPTEEVLIEACGKEFRSLEHEGDYFYATSLEKDGNQIRTVKSTTAINALTLLFLLLKGGMKYP